MNSKQLAKALQGAKLKTNNTRLNPQPNLKNLKKRKLKTKPQEDTVSNPDDSDSIMEIEDDSPKKVSELEILKEENKLLKEQLRRLNEILEKDRRNPLPTSNFFSPLSEENTEARNVNMTSATTSNPGHPDDERERLTAIKNKNRKPSPRKQQRTNPSNRPTTAEGASVHPTTEMSTAKKEKVPPITIYRQDVKDTIEVLSKVLSINKFQIKRQSANQHRVIVNSYDEHKKAKDILKDVDAQYYTYTPRQEKVQTFILKGVDGSFEPAEILNYLKEFESPELKFVNVNRHTTIKSIKENKTLPLFRVQISADSIAGKLHQIKHVAHQVVWWEKIKKRDAVQCRNCQRLGHMASNCNMKYRCVKCNEPHGPKECQLNLNSREIPKEKIFCVLCQAFGHPASYRGCPKQLEFKARKAQNNIAQVNTALQKNRLVYAQQNAVGQAQFPANSNVIPGMTFADRLRGQNSNVPKAQMIRPSPIEPACSLEAMQQQIALVMQAVLENSQKIDKLFQLVAPNQPRS